MGQSSPKEKQLNTWESIWIVGWHGNHIFKINASNWVYCCNGCTGRKSKLSLTNKLLIYNTILKPIWTYGAPIWGKTSQSNIEILQRLQNKILRMATDAPWYIPNHMLQTDLQIPTIREEITRLSTNYKAKIEVHPNKLTTSFLAKQGPGRLRRYSPLDLPNRFIT